MNKQLNQIRRKDTEQLGSNLAVANTIDKHNILASANKWS